MWVCGSAPVPSKHHQEVLSKCRQLGPTSRPGDSAGQGRSWAMCISFPFPAAATLSEHP